MSRKTAKCDICGREMDETDLRTCDYCGARYCYYCGSDRFLCGDSLYVCVNCWNAEPPDVSSVSIWYENKTLVKSNE